MEACQFFYECKSYDTVLKPNPSDCCVFCSFGSVKCLPIQALANAFELGRRVNRARFGELLLRRTEAPTSGFFPHV